MSSEETRDEGPLDFRTVYGQFHLRIRRYLERLMPFSDAEDVAQEVFVKASRALPQFRGESSLSTWMYRIATNAAYDRLRSPSFRREGDVPLAGEVPVEDRSPGAELTLVRREMNDCIGRYIARLPTSYRAVIVLSEHEGLTNQEIADTLAVSLDTVKIRLHRARARLRRELGSGCSFYRDERNELACEPKPVIR
jgi:RNA polymerase sigma-70 factor, ECF subfamily